MLVDDDDEGISFVRAVQERWKFSSFGKDRLDY